MSNEELIAEIRDGHARQVRREGEPPMCLACSPVDWPCDAVRAADALEYATRERDAALAAIERVREEHQPCYTCAEPHCFRCKEAKWPCVTFQALDGAPEPEWEWGVRASGDDEPFSDVYQTREHLAEHETGIAWGEEQLVRRRPAGPWLPVEGESNGV